MNFEMHIAKSSRHAKIAGDFGEMLVLYWLSKYGFECAKVDHTGIDLIARNPNTKERMGISVKCRTRDVGTEMDSVAIKKKDFDKIGNACEAFGCTPYLAMVVDAGKTIRIFITPIKHFLETYAGSGWKMSDGYLTRYAKDSEVMVFELNTETKRWWG